MHLYQLPRIVSTTDGKRPSSSSSFSFDDTLPDLSPSDDELEDTQPLIQAPGAYDDFYEAPTAPGVTLGANPNPGGDLSSNELAALHDSTFERVLHVVAERMKRLFPAHSALDSVPSMNPDERSKT